MSRRSPIASSLPRVLYVEVTNRCNSRCQTCIRTFQTLEPTRDLTLTEFRDIVDTFPALDRIVMHGIGEPLLHPDLPVMVGYAKERHPSATVMFNSNAVLLDEERRRALLDAGLDEFRVSLDAASPETYSQIRGIAAFEQVVDNVRALAEAAGRGRPRLSFWLASMRENLDELPALVDLAAKIGVPEVYVQRLVLTGQGLAHAEQSLYRRVEEEQEAALAEAARRAHDCGVTFSASGLATPEESLRGRSNGDRPWTACHRLWTTTYITANGNVLPCCIAPFAAHNYASILLGSVFEQSFADIWNGDAYVRWRAALYSAQPMQPCAECGVSWSL
jgi:MoaA/NifB/PqqE/SkfB family radical SAM enzyme